MTGSLREISGTYDLIYGSDKFYVTLQRLCRPLIVLGHQRAESSLTAVSELEQEKFPSAHASLVRVL